MFGGLESLEINKIVGELLSDTFINRRYWKETFGIMIRILDSANENIKFLIRGDFFLNLNAHFAL